MESTVFIRRVAWLLVLLAAGLDSGCTARDPRLATAAATAALAAVVGPLPDGLEVLFHERRGLVGGAWVIRTSERWRPHGATDHRHANLPVETFMNTVAALSRGSLDLGRPLDAACEYTEWRSVPTAESARIDLRIHQVRTDQGEWTVLETLPDPAGV